jgi:murein DD-endopeptidase MepM/ murein hydrolase activator NlpD
LSYIKISKKGISVMSISITLSICSILYYYNKPNAYEVSVDKKVVAYVKDDKNDLDIVWNLVDEVSRRFSSSKLKDTISINKVKVNEDFLTKDTLIRKTIIENSDILVDAYSMSADGREFAVVANENEGKIILDKVKNYYNSKSGLEIKESVLKTNIKYVKKKTLISQVDNIDLVVNRIEAVNAKSQKQLVTFELKGTVQGLEAVPPSIVIQWSEDMTVGQSKLLSNGEEGKKTLIREKRMENSKIVGTRVISEKITILPKDKVVLQGKKTPIMASKGILFTPSRGAISSGFGMRWGKMHEGLDIAASMGDPIYAALDGSVVYSGWETGYGYVIKLQHQNGLLTIYGHCSRLDVSVGQSVDKGDQIGLVGNTGNSTGPHLHFEVRVNGVPQNPVAFLK